MATKLGTVVTHYNFNLLSYATVWTRGHGRSLDELKTFYLHYHKSYGYQTLQNGYT